MILAGRERLDTTLEIGHMQGKFQLKVMTRPYVGHLVHEVSVVHLGVSHVDMNGRDGAD